jgi:hypothetical protein
LFRARLRARPNPRRRKLIGSQYSIRCGGGVGLTQ